jgi:hypothetical protein
LSNGKWTTKLLRGISRTRRRRELVICPTSCVSFSARRKPDLEETGIKSHVRREPVLEGEDPRSYACDELEL